jgi:Protein of unknown function (DUF4239)
VIRAILNAVPAYVLLVVVVAVTLAVVVLAVWLVRRAVPATRDGFHAEVSAPMLGVVAALFGLLLAFVIIIAYQNYLSAGADVSREADALASIVRDSDAFPKSDGIRVRGAVGEYARAITDDEWPQMRDGRSSPAASRALDGVVAALQTTQPRSPAARGFYNDSVSQLNDALVARRDRLEAASGGLPWELTSLILFSAFVILGYALLVGSPHFWFHALGPVAIGIVVAFSLVVLFDLSYPFSGDVTISPQPYKTGVLAQFFQPSR